MEPRADIESQYAEFADYAVGESACFEGWARGVLADAEVLAWLATLPPEKRQPTLVFAAARWHGVPAPGPYDGLRSALLGDDGTIRATILSRATQTNEVGRLATLVPAFASLAGDEPLSLVEVGASAGLCLLPDRWGYEWATTGGAVGIGPEPRLRCRVSGAAPIPEAVPQVAGRVGVDLNPLDVADPDAMAWLETLVWPEHDERRARLAHAVALARTNPPRIVRGDLLEELPGLITDAASYGVVVVFHSAVIAYLEDADRTRFHQMMTRLVATGACYWVSNEAPNVLPDVTATAGSSRRAGTFVLGIDGQPVAWTHGHGRTLHWLG